MLKNTQLKYDRQHGVSYKNKAWNDITEKDFKSK